MLTLSDIDRKSYSKRNYIVSLLRKEIKTFFGKVTDNRTSWKIIKPNISKVKPRSETTLVEGEKILVEAAVHRCF